MRVEYRHGTSPQALTGMAVGSVGAIVADPPYGTGNSDDHQYGRRQRWGVDHGTAFIQNDRSLKTLADCAPRLLALLAREGVALFFMAPTERRAAEDVLHSAGFDVYGNAPWDKGAPGLSHRLRHCFEDCLIAVHPGIDPFETEPKRGALIVPLRVPRVRHTSHPTEKPVRLLRDLIRWALPAGGLVLDPFAGIASCGVAAIAQRCDYVGVECDPQWWPIADRRLAEAQNRPHADVGQNGLFTEEPAA